MCTTITEEINFIKDVLSCDRKAEQLFYEKYKEVIYNYIRYKFPVNNEIEDDVSEIMIKVFIGLKTFDIGKTRLKTWVINISKNYMIDKWRVVKPTMVSGYELVIDSSDGENFDAIDLIRHISGTTNSNDYFLLNMKYFDGYKLSEIGNEFNLTTSKTLNKISNIKAKIKEKYKNQI